MGKTLRIILLAILILIPIVFYNFLNKKNEEVILPIANKKLNINRPKIALIFDDLGESLKDLKEIYSLDIPVSVSVIPGLKFSRNIAHIAYRCGFSVLIHLPLQPKDEENYKTDKYKFIKSSLSRREIESLLRYYLNSIRVAIGVNNHMGSAATEDTKLMKIVLKAIKRKGLIFIDSCTSPKSVAYALAKEGNIICGYNEGFLDSNDSMEAIEKKLNEFIDKAKEKGKIIIIAHPKENTIKVLKRKLPLLKEKVEFVTLKDYFEL
jgi:hypothetical protein